MLRAELLEPAARRDRETLEAKCDTPAPTSHIIIALYPHCLRAGC